LKGKSGAALGAGPPKNRPTMVQFEQKKMEETIETLKEQKEELVKENKKLSAENFFFHQSTTIFINLKKVMEMEKSYYY